MRKICVLGLGYIGLPTAAVLATSGLDVVGVDTDSSVLQTLRRGELHIEEPGLRTMVEAASKSGRLSLEEKPEPADTFIICVPTPLTTEKTADLSYVVSASEAIVPHLRAGNLVIVESTIPPGTSRDLVAPILEKSGLTVGPGHHEILLVHCPERVIPGQVVREIISNDRVIGGTSHTAAERAQELYSRFVEGELHLTDATTAEMVKLIENTFRDVNIALANELARVSEMLGLNAWEIIDLANHHPRVHLHHPGPGVGGHCLPIDPWFIVEKASGQAQLIQTARSVNDGQPALVAKLVQETLVGIDRPRVVLLGEAYKENVDDARESPTRDLVPLLEANGIEVMILDPHTRRGSWKAGEIDVACQNADLVVLMCAHSEFLELEAESIGSRMRNRLLLDTRAALNLDTWRASGFSCRLLGNGRRITDQ
ncbi:nucleotide sugar dehydrogenase [Candidatus Bipolaricaulota bacterium]